MSNRTAGFTVIELAIVLVVVGLLLGGMLRAQELVHSAKAKNLANDFRVVPTLLYAYQDRYRALPGDDAAAPEHVAGVLASGSTRGDGHIDGPWNSTSDSEESRLFWQHVRLARLVDGPTDPTDPLYTPRNAIGGIIGFSGAAASQLQVAGMRGEYQLCSTAIPGRIAKQLDVMLDDGDTATGQMRAVPAGAALQTPAQALAAIEDNAAYTVCMTY